MERTRTQPHRRRLAARLALAVAAPLVFLLALEGLLALAGLEGGVPLPAAGSRPREVKPGGAPRLQRDPYLIRDPITLSAMRPGFEGRHKGAAIRINELGMRGPETTPEKPPGTHRALCLGDSITFGWAVEEPQCYPARLQALLRQRHPALSIEVLNGGIPTQTSWQGLLRLRDTDLLTLEPEVVVLCYGFNDQTTHKQRDRVRTELVRATPREPGPAARWVGGTRTYGLMQRMLRPATARLAAARKTRHVRVPLPEYAENLEAMALLLREREIRVVLVDQVYEGLEPSAYNPALEELAARREVPLVRVLAPLREAARRLPEGEPILLDECHPSPAGHQAIAEAVAEALRGWPA